jgi:membrane protein implicated in regulation of membrane protease activity
MVSLPVIWLLIGVILITIEFASMGATALISEVAGFTAFLIAGLALLIPEVHIQVIIWVAISLIAIWYSRRFIPKGQLSSLDAQEGRTLTPIPKGQAGRVRFEGQSWRAVSADPDLDIPANTEVTIMTQQGNTLVVMPKHWLNRSLSADKNP